MTREINYLEQEIETAQDTILSAVEELLSTPSEITKTPKTEEHQKIEQHTRTHVKKVIEALLFATNEPIPFLKLREIIDSIYPLQPRLLRSIIQDLQEEYLSQQRAFCLEEIAQGYLLRSCEEYRPYIDLLYRNKRGEKLSPASAEVLAIIAYKQPITRPQIDAIRGVDSSGTLHNLLERGLIEGVGKLEAPGRPTLYGITQEFLKHFGLRDIKELPQLKN
jgi:segregation and condensation protein B